MLILPPTQILGYTPNQNMSLSMISTIPGYVSISPVTPADYATIKDSPREVFMDIFTDYQQLVRFIQHQGDAVLLFSTPTDLGFGFEYSLDRESAVTIYYNDVDIALGDPSLVPEMARVIATYHYDLGDGDFLVLVPDDTTASSLEAMLSSIANQRRISIQTQPAIGDQPLLVVDSMRAFRTVETTMGGIQDTQVWISKDRADVNARVSSGITHRMCTPGFYQRLVRREIPRIPSLVAYRLLSTITVNQPPEVMDAILPQWRLQVETPFLDMLSFSPELQTVLSRWLDAGYPAFPMVSCLSLLERCNPTLLPLPPAEANQTPGQYQLAVGHHRKSKHMTYAGADHVETLLNIWVDLLDYLLPVSSESGLENFQRVTSWCRERGIDADNMQSVVRLVVSSLNTLEKLGYRVEHEMFSPSEFMDLAREFFTQVYSDRVGERLGLGLYPEYAIGDTRYRIGNRLVPSALIATIPQAVLVLLSDRALGGVREILIGISLGDNTIVTAFEDNVNHVPTQAPDIGATDDTDDN